MGIPVNPGRAMSYVLYTLAVGLVANGSYMILNDEAWGLLFAYVGVVIGALTAWIDTADLDDDTPAY